MNDDSSLPYADFLSPFIDRRKVVLDDADCDPGHLGCLYDAEVRLYCNIESYEVRRDAECDSAGNLRHPSAKPQLLAIGSGSSTLRVKLPSGASTSVVVHSTGGSLQRICERADACGYRLLDFGFVLSKPVDLGLFELVEATAAFVGTPIGSPTRSGGVAFAEDTTELWVSGLARVGAGSSQIEVPVEFGLSASDAMLTRYTPVAFSIESFHAIFSGYDVELATAAAAAGPR